MEISYILEQYNIFIDIMNKFMSRDIISIVE
jgi:hypothetical protein